MTKGRNWAFIVYPESLPENYEEIITELGLPMTFSPLHDKDINPDGEEKKPHYHVICYYENTTTYKNVLENVCKKLNGTIPKKLESLKGMYRYHLHLDNPEKYQYDDRERRFFNGFDVNKVDSLTYTEKSKILWEIQDFIEVNDITEYRDLCNIFKDSELKEMWDVAKDSTYFLNAYIKSRKYKKQEEKQKKVDIKK